MPSRIKPLLPVLTIIFLLALQQEICSAGAPGNIDTGPEEMVLKTHSGIKSARFPHRSHQAAFDCGQCHHAKSKAGIKLPYSPGMKVEKCVVCHNKEDMVSPKLNNFKLVAHGLCKGCHKKQEDSAPTKCSGCHIK